MGWSWNDNPVTNTGKSIGKGVHDVVSGAGDLGTGVLDWLGGNSGSGGNSQQQDLFNQVGVGPSALPNRQQTIMNVLNEQLAVIKKRQGDALGTGTTGDQTPTLASTVLFGVGQGGMSGAGNV